MDYEAVGTTHTRLAISTKETFAVSDWGRGQHLARTILDGLAAQPA